MITRARLHVFKNKLRHLLGRKLGLHRTHLAQDLLDNALNIFLRVNQRDVAKHLLQSVI